MNRVYEQYPLLAAIDPATVTSTPATSSWVDTAGQQELFAELQIGNVAAETVDFKIEQATDSSGTGVKDLKAATQLAAHATNNDNKQVQISVAIEKLDTANGFRYVRIRAVTGGATGGPMAGTLRGRGRNRPATQASSVVQVATL